MSSSGRGPRAHRPLGDGHKEHAIQPARHPDLEPAAEPAVEEALEADEQSPGPSSARGFLWTTLAWGVNRVAILGLTLILARLLTPEDFGLVTAALTIIAMLDAALDLGVGASVVAEQEHGITDRTRTAFTLSLLIATGVAGLGAAASPLIATLFDAPGESWLFALIFLYPLFRGAGQVNDAVLKRDLLFRRRTLVDLARAAVRVVVSITLALTVGGAISIAAGIVISELVAMLTLWVLVPVRPAWRLSQATVRSLLAFGGQITAIRILGSFRSTFDYIVVGAILGTAALGMYSMAYKLPELVIENVLWIFSAIALPAYARALAVNRVVLLRTMLRATRLLSLYGLAAGVVLAVLARDAIPVLFSAQWEPAVVPMMLISVSLGVMSIAWANGDVLAALGRLRVLVALDVPATAVMAIAFLLAPRWGLVGVASVHLAFNVVYCVIRTAVVRRVTELSSRDVLAAVLPAVLVALITAVVGFGVRAMLPPGTLMSLLVLGGTCALTVAGAALLVARSTVVDGLRALLPSLDRTRKAGA